MATLPAAEPLSTPPSEPSAPSAPLGADEFELDLVARHYLPVLAVVIGLAIGVAVIASPLPVRIVAALLALATATVALRHIWRVRAGDAR